jgi:hypothetical protein
MAPALSRGFFYAGSPGGLLQTIEKAEKSAILQAINA